MLACCQGEPWLAARAALNMKGAKLWCHGRTEGDGRAGEAAGHTGAA